MNKYFIIICQTSKNVEGIIFTNEEYFKQNLSLLNASSDYNVIYSGRIINFTFI